MYVLYEDIFVDSIYYSLNVFYNILAVLAIAGATSVGKTELSLKLASLLNGEIISADSAQV